MAPSAQAHKRAHSLLLFEKLLNLRDSASPLTLVLDTLEQSAQPLTNEFMRRAKLERAKIVFVSLATIKKPALADVFIRARGKPLKALAVEIASHVAPPRTTAAATTKDGISPPVQKTLIVIDNLNPLTSHQHHQPTPSLPSLPPLLLLPTFFSTLVTGPSTSLVAVYHTDVPDVPATPAAGRDQHRQYHQYLPDPPTLLAHLATTVLRVSGVGHAVAARRARERSLPEPGWGLREGREGVLVGLREGQDRDGGGGGGAVVVEMEMRRRSGRAVVERFVLSPPPPPAAGGKGPVAVVVVLWGIILLLGLCRLLGERAARRRRWRLRLTLGWTEKQRRDREGVVLPYFDAQVDVGGGEGGRILYDMGREDDFDEEEDEI